MTEKDPIQKIIDALRNDKMMEMKDDLNALIKKKGLKSIDLKQKLLLEKKEVKIQTGTLLDEIIGGGLAPKSSMLLWGEYGAGKTQTCLSMAIECPYDVIYIDAENSFRSERIEEICEARGKNLEEVLQKIHLYQPVNWIEQMRCLFGLPSPADTRTGKIGLIIVDSLTKLFRGVEFAGRQNLQTKQPLLREFIFRLNNIIRVFEAALIFTTQIYESPQAKPFLPDWSSHKPVGGASLLHQPDYVVMLRRASGNIRIARMMDSSWQPLGERPFVITEKGVEDLPMEAKAREILLKKAEKYEKKQKQEEQKKRKKKYKEEKSDEIYSNEENL